MLEATIMSSSRQAPSGVGSNFTSYSSNASEEREQSSCPTNTPKSARVLAILEEMQRQPINNFEDNEDIEEQEMTEQGTSAPITLETHGMERKLSPHNGITMKERVDSNEPGTMTNTTVIAAEDDWVLVVVDEKKQVFNSPPSKRIPNGVKAEVISHTSGAAKCTKGELHGSLQSDHALTSDITRSSKKSRKRIRVRDKTSFCAFCNRKYDCKARLIAHLRTHTGEKPYACDKCDFRSVRKYNLTAHKRTHLKRHVCEECGFGTNSQVSMQVHMRNHNVIDKKACAPQKTANVSNMDSGITWSDENLMGEDFTVVECSPDIGVTELAVENDGNTSKSRISNKVMPNASSKKSNKKMSTSVVMTVGSDGCTQDILGVLDLTADATAATTKELIGKKSKRKPRVPENIFTCAVCSHNFDRKWRLIVHLRTHTGEKPYACDQCDYRGARKHYLTSHKLTHVKRYACGECRFQGHTEMSLQLHVKRNHETISKKSARNFVTVECSPDILGVVDLTDDVPDDCKSTPVRKEKTTKNTLTCAHCGRKFDTKSRLLAHVKMHSVDKPYACDKCSYASAQKHNLAAHKLTHSEGKNFACDQCSFQTNNKKTIEIHKRNHKGEKPFECDVCEYRSARRHNLAEHKLTHSEFKTYSCSECDFETNNKRTIEIHERNHKGEKPYACDQCNYRSSNKYALAAHQVSHTKEKPYWCKECSYRGKDSRALNAHMKTHSKEKRFKCPYCDYGSYRSIKLKTHIRSHTGEKPFSCDQCDYTSAHASYMKVHMRIHTGEKPFACPKCDFKCRQAPHLRIHMANHDGQKRFVCKDCDYSTSILSHFKEHVRVHSEEKPYSCDSCDKRFREGHHLKRHMLSLHPDKPYKCDACGYECNIKQAFEEHLRRCEATISQPL